MTRLATTTLLVRCLLRHRRSAAAVAIGLSACTVLLLGAAIWGMDFGRSACWAAAAAGLAALVPLLDREHETSAASRRQNGAGEAPLATDSDLTDAARRHDRTAETTGRLAAGVAHDFNNILQIIIGSLDLAMDEIAVDSPAHQFADMALTAAMRGAHLTHHLLAYAGKQMLCPQPIEAAAFLSDLDILLSRTLGPHIAIDLRVLDAPILFADPTELQTALRNIAINAADAMPAGGTLLIDARGDSATGRSWIRITMTDTGAGMDAATLAHAVEPFFTTKGINRTGLGLSMAHGFAGQSGGSLRIASAPGRGTTVELRLPAATSAGRLVMDNAGGARRHRPLRQYG